MPRCSGAWLGPNKTFDRAFAKALKDYLSRDDPAAHLLDLARATVIFDDPYTLAVFAVALEQTLPVVRRKNRFVGDELPGGYRDMLLNVLCGEHVCEVQLALKQLSDVKEEMHRYYEVERLASADELHEHWIFAPPVINVASCPSSLRVNAANSCPFSFAVNTASYSSSISSHETCKYSI